VGVYLTWTGKQGSDQCPQERPHPYQRHLRHGVVAYRLQQRI
jgi:hypothetical protein